MREKQVIIMRKDLSMRKGKMIAQGAHASSKVIFDMMRVELYDRFPEGKRVVRTLTLGDNDPINKWLTNKFTKICVYCNSEDELFSLKEAAANAGLPYAVIVDSGLTEFNNVQTKTCMAIGPANADEIDKITAHLKLL
jgi:PTH2 family peptidyl-tRNA hydrolase